MTYFNIIKEIRTFRSSSFWVFQPWSSNWICSCIFSNWLRFDNFLIWFPNPSHWMNFKYLCSPGEFFLFFFFLSSADFFQNQFFRKILSGIRSECQTVWIQIRPDILSGLVWVHTVYKSYQKTTLGDKEYTLLSLMGFPIHIDTIRLGLFILYIEPFHSRYRETGTLANHEDPDEMLPYASGSSLIAKIKQS